VVREVTIRKTEIRGTPLYMAPEQILGRDIDARADLYEVGCTFYELVSGRPPFVEGEILYHQINTAVDSPIKHAPDLPAAGAQLIVEMLGKSARERPPSAQAIRDRLRGIS
jgi:serine/threonine protein kinase